MLEIISLTVGLMATHCYLVYETTSRACLIVDPGDDAEYITDTVMSHRLTPLIIIATHGHFDHILAARAVQLAYTIPFILHGRDSFLVARMASSAKHFLGLTHIDPPPIIGQTVSDGDTISVGDSKVTILHTPGHSPGSICIYDEAGGSLLVGDTIFAEGAVGRTDHTYASRSDLEVSLSRILHLPQDTRLLPGHGEETTVKQEIVFHAL